MAIPDFQSIMRPLLVHLADGRERTNQETLDAIAETLGVTADERALLLPSGKQPMFVNKVAWAKSHLKNAGLIESPRRAVYRITDRGQELLQRHAGPINMRVLDQYPEYQQFRQPSADGAPTKAPPTGGQSLTPEEHLEYGYQQIRTQLVADLLETVKAVPPGVLRKARRGAPARNGLRWFESRRR